MSNKIIKLQEVCILENHKTYWHYIDSNSCFVRMIHTSDGSVIVKRHVQNDNDLIIFQFFYMGHVYTERILNSNYSLRYTITLAKRFAKETVKIVNSYWEDEL